MALYRLFVALESENAFIRCLTDQSSIGESVV